MALPLTRFSDKAPSLEANGFKGTDATVSKNPSSVARVLAKPEMIAEVVSRMTPAAKLQVAEVIADDELGIAGTSKADRLREIEAEERQRNRADTVDHAEHVMALLNKAARTIHAAARECQGVEWSDENKEFIAWRIKQTEEMLNMMKTAVNGTIEVDWDKELAGLL